MKRANGRCGIGLAVALALLAGGEARAAVNVYQVGSGQTYTTVQSALNVARTNNANGDTQIVRIMDSGGYTNENIVLTGTWGTRKLVLEANAGQTPTLFAITLAQTIGEVTLSGLKFRSPSAGTTINGAVVITQNGGTLTAPITITNCNFEQTGNAAGQGWVNGIYVRASTSGTTYGKVTVTGCGFDMTAGAASLVSAGVAMYAGNNYANVEVTDCVFLGGYRGIYDPNTASSMMVALNIHNNLFHSQNYAGYNNNQNNIDYAYLAIENNTFVKIYDRSGSFESGGAIAIRGRTDLSTLVIKDNLIVDDMSSTLCAGFSGFSTAVTALNADYNAFVAMTGNMVGYWNSLQKTLADLNGLTGAGNNIENDTLTPANLFANYGGTDYRKDYRLKSGVWALTAASDGSYVGAFGRELPTVTVTASDPAASETGPDNGEFTVSRGTRTDGALVVNYTLPVSGTATPGSGAGGDYTTTPAANYGARTGSVTIPDSSSSATVTVTPVDDAAAELTETVILTLASDAAYTVGSPSSDTVSIADNDAGNLKPVVVAGPSQNVISNSLPASTRLEGSATDPDNGPTSPMTYQWAKVSGPGTVTFGDATVTNTSASFATAGAYVLSLSAYDGADTGSNTVTITVYDNEAPVVDAGVGQTITLATVASLDGTLTTDDGLPGPPTYLWTKDSGPGAVTFGNSSLIDTTATFDQLGAYVLKLTATDGLGLSGSDTVSITVRDVIVFTATNSARFNVAGTWDPAGGPPMVGDTAVISNVTVSTLSAGEVPAGVTVSLLDTGVLWCADSGSAVQPIASNATINIASGATLRVDNRNTIVGTNNLNGGTLSLSTGGEVGSGCTLNVNADSVVRATSAGSRIRILGKATGTGKLTVTGTPGSTTGDGISLATNSTWSGAWDVQDGVVRFGGDTGQQILPGDLRVADGATAEQAGVKTIIGTRSGGGTNAVYQNAVLTIGNGTTDSPGRGWLSPGDAGVNGGVGSVTVACTAGSASPSSPTLRFASNSTYVVDIRGTTSALYDAVSVVGKGAGTGKVDIVTGAILTVNLWTPPGGAMLNAKIIDTAIGTGGDGVLTGTFTVTNWLNSAGWRNLNVSASNGDLFVTGEYPPSGTVVIVR